MGGSQIDSEAIGRWVADYIDGAEPADLRDRAEKLRGRFGSPSDSPARWARANIVIMSVLEDALALPGKRAEVAGAEAGGSPRSGVAVPPHPHATEPDDA